jgi:ribosome-associated heat shock protein Hsp15
MDTTPAIRVDRWLWAVRLYRTRSLATAACRAGQVRVNDLPCKPARSIRVGDVIIALTGVVRRTVKVRALLEQRVGAAKVPEFLDDLTPASEYDQLKQKSLAPTGNRPRGAGRPTKRDRRKLTTFFSDADAS